MGLTWRDLVSSVAVLAVILTWVAYRVAALPLIASASRASVVALILAACCAVAAASDLHTTPQSGLGVVYRRITTVTGAIALAAGLVGALGGSGQALEILVVSTGVLWGTATIWHVLTIGAEQ